MYVPQFSRTFQDRFANRPPDAIDLWRSSASIASVNPGIESAVLYEEDIPGEVNGLRLDKLYLMVQTATANAPIINGFKVRVYAGEIRNPAGPTFNVPPKYELNLSASPFLSTYPIYWLLLPGIHWQLTFINISGTQMVLPWLGVTGWYF